MYEKLRLGVSPITKTVYLGRLTQDKKLGMSIWATGKRDITQDFLRCVIDRFLDDPTVIEGNGRKFEITVTEIADSKDAV